MDPSDPEPRLVRRETVLLVVLSLAAAFLFVLTREFEQRGRAATLADAGAWFDIGERQLREGQTAAAVTSLRHATSRNRDNRSYVLTLARALAANGQGDEATRVLVNLRDLTPDDPSVNTELARLAAERSDVREAQRYYQNALYGIWPAGRDDDRRRLRVELILFLLQHDERNRALSEVVALSANIPDAAPALVETGQLFLAVGAPDRALASFTRALTHAAGDNDALAGAGEAAFALGDYAGARRYLGRATNLPDRLAQLNEVSRLVIDADPLQPRLTLTGRRDRLSAALARARQRLDECVAARPDTAAGFDATRAELAALVPDIEIRVLRDKPETAERALDAIVRAERAADPACGTPTALDRALELIAERHQGASS